MNKSHEKDLFAEIKSVIFTRPKFTISLRYIDFLSCQRNLLFQIISLIMSS